MDAHPGGPQVGVTALDMFVCAPAPPTAYLHFRDTDLLHGFMYLQVQKGSDNSYCAGMQTGQGSGGEVGRCETASKEAIA